MCKRIGKKALALLLTSALTALTCQQMFAGGKKAKVSKELETITYREEEGFYYGKAKAATTEEAMFKAKKDLIENALTATLKKESPRSQSVHISDEAVSKRLASITPDEMDKAKTTIIYKISEEEWARDEALVQDTLRSELESKYSVLTSKKTSLSEKINESVEILNTLTLNGEYGLLKLIDGGEELYSKKIEALCNGFIDQMEFELSAKDGFIGPDNKTFEVTVKDEKGKGIPGLKVKAVWNVALTAIEAAGADLPEVVTYPVTDSNGKISIPYPEKDFTDKCVTLTVSTAFSTSELATSAMRKFDAKSSVDAFFVNTLNLADEYKTVLIEAGEFTAGKVDQDRKATSNEYTHVVDLPAYEMGVSPVTNGMFAKYIFATRGETLPEYFENADYNQENQPVIGVSMEEALAYAAWLSEQTGETYRLPTEEEWEKACRAGTTTIYPWGDEDASKGVKANYKNNKKFKGPSPVGAFETAVNAWGLADMCGNVWEWTSSNHKAGADVIDEALAKTAEEEAKAAAENAPAEPVAGIKEEVAVEVLAEGAAEEAAEEVVEEDDGYRTVKGGSWMDGPTELRVSNFKNVVAADRYSDVGFRLVKEVK